jgi:uncharacterized tellurite resistance protein B-like protein
MSILRFLGLADQKPPQSASKAETETVRKIVETLDHLEPERARYVAAFAYILSRVANADMSISKAETHEMERIVMERSGLPEEQAIIVVQMAKTRNAAFGATDNFLVTREFNRIASADQKLRLLHCLFAVSAAEGSISAAEDSEIRQIASELQLQHRDFISVRSAYRDRLAVLKDLPDRIPDPGGV